MPCCLPGLCVFSHSEAEDGVEFKAAATPTQEGITQTKDPKDLGPDKEREEGQIMCH